MHYLFKTDDQFETRLLNPTPDAVAAELTAAAAELFDELSRLPQLKLSPAAAKKAAKQVAKSPEGWEHWRAGRTQTPAALLVLGWWTDHAGRKHVAVRGRDPVSGTASVYLDRDEMATRPPLWHTFPEAAVRRLTPHGSDWLVACGCGAVGTPEAVGWMGDCCGPCHDRREEDGPAALADNLRGLARVKRWEPVSVAFDPSGRRLAVGETEVAVSLWSVRGSAEPDRVKLGSGMSSDKVNRVAFSSDGRYVIAASWSSLGGVAVFDTAAKKLKEVARLKSDGTGLTAGPPGTVAFLDGDAITVRSVPGMEEVRRFDYPGCQQRRPQQFGGPGHAVLITPDGFDVIDLKTGKRTARVPASAKWKAKDTGYNLTTRFAFDPKRKRLVVNMPWLEVYDTASGRRLAGVDWNDRAFEPRPDRNYWLGEIALSRDGRWLYGGGLDGRVYVVDVDTLTPVAAFEWHMGWLTSIAVSPDGKLLATAGDCETAVKLWPIDRLMEGLRA